MLVIPVLFSVLLTGCNENKSVITPAEDNIVEFLKSEADYAVLAGLIEGTVLENTLSGNTSYTLLAPTDAAFAKLPVGTLDGLTNQQKLDILRYHVMPGQVQLNADSFQETRQSLHGDPVFITVQSGSGRVNNSAAVVSKNRSVSNGIVHKIDEILFPDIYGTVLDNIRKRYTLAGLNDQFEALELTGYLDGDEYVSLMIPPAAIYDDIESWMEISLTDEEKAEIWKYNLVHADLNGAGPGTQTALQTVMGDSIYLTMIHPGQYLFNRHYATDENLTTTIRSVNGTLYETDVLLVPDKYQGVLTLMDKRYYLNTVRAGFAVAKMTGRMYNVLSNADEKFTVFIPWNNATGLGNLPADEEGLANILKYHVLLEKVTADQLQHNQTYTTWQGEEITITRNGDSITINGTARIKLADLEGTNGVVHVIDQVLMPS